MTVVKQPVRTRRTAHTSHEVEASSDAQDNLRHVVEYVAPSALKPPARELRRRNPRQLSAIGASMKAYGFTTPILIDDEGLIVAGHGRWLAAKALKMAAVPVIRLSHLSKEDLRAYAIADNRLGELAEFDLKELKLEISELDGLDLNLELTGFTTAELDQMLAIAVDEDDDGEGTAGLEEDEPAVTRLGDVWVLGDHRLLCGDALEAVSYTALLAGEKAQMVFVDAPYDVPMREISGKGQHKHRPFAMGVGELGAAFPAFVSKYSRHLVEHSIDGSIHYQCIDWKHICEMKAGGDEVYVELKNLVVWAKQTAGMGTFYRSQHEMILVWKSGTAPHINNFGLGATGRYRTNVWNYDGNAGFHSSRDGDLSIHPTVKPVSLVADAMRDCSKRGGIILDPFGGSGTTIIAAERTHRKARVIEIDPLYCDAAIRRWEKLTGQTAKLSATDQSFADVAAARGVLMTSGDEAETQSEELV